MVWVWSWSLTIVMLQVTHHDHHHSVMCSFRSNLIDISIKLGQVCKSDDNDLDIDIEP